jgi:hypothetical protein
MTHDNDDGWGDAPAEDGSDEWSVETDADSESAGAEGGSEDATPGVEADKPPAQDTENARSVGENVALAAGQLSAFGQGVRDGWRAVRAADDKDSWAGAVLGRKAMRGIATFCLNIALLVTNFVPKGWKMWRAVCHAGYRGMQMSSSADYIGHISVGGEIKHVPLYYDHERGKLETSAGDWWNIAAEGENTYRVAGRVPAVWASDRSNEVGSHVQAEVAAALDIGGDRDLRTDATVQSYQVFMDGDAGEDASAIADGGVSKPQPVGESQVTVADPGQFVDQLVDLDAGLDAEDSARVTSMDKYYQTYPSVVDPEEMKRQEERGMIAAKDQDLESYVVKVLLIALGFVAAALGAVWLLSSTGGGGGSAIGGLLGTLAPLGGL